MDFEFSEEQALLRTVAREFLTEQCPVEHVRRMMDDPVGYDKGIYRRMADLGLLGLPFPESYGGAGLGMVEQAIVLEEMGRTAYPGPYVASVVLAGTAIMASGDDRARARYLPGIGTGELTATLAFLEDDINWGPGAIGLRATEDGDGYRLDGQKRFVPFGHAVDVILVAARTGEGVDGDGEEGVTLLAVPRETAGLTVEPNVTLDLDSKVSTLRFDGARVPQDAVVGQPGAAWPVLAATLQRAAVAASAEMLGAARKSLEMSIEYAKVREQFG